jgi:hypothetical protein
MNRPVFAFVFIAVLSATLLSCGYSRKKTGCPMPLDSKLSQKLPQQLSR